MAIYNIFDYAEKETLNSEEAKKTLDKVNLAEVKVGFHEEVSRGKDRFFSSLAARFFFLMLLVADFFWGIYVIAMLLLTCSLSVVTFFTIPLLNRLLSRFYLSLKRFLVAALSLFVSLISPALGIMFACTYFLMYDREGIDEIVPSSLRAQFKEFFA